MPEESVTGDCSLLIDLRNVRLPILVGTDKTIDLQAVFGNDYPVELEIGSGRCLFLQRESQARPHMNFVGVEYSKKFAMEGALRIAEAGSQNVRILRCDARPLILAFPDRSIQATHIYYPDPWWKRRHRKRRIMQVDFLLQIARVLVPEGILYFATDVEEYFHTAEKTVARLPQFRKTDLPAIAQRNEQEHLTHFERKYRLEGRPVYRTQWQRVLEV